MPQLRPVPVTRAAVRWSLGHALPRAVLRRAAKEGDLHGRMFVATHSGRGSELGSILDELRAQGPLYQGKYASVSADNATVRALLSNPDAGSGVAPGDGGNRLARLQAWGMQDAPLGPLTPPSLLVTEPPDHTRYRKLVSASSVPVRSRSSAVAPSRSRPSSSTGSTRTARSTSSRRTAPCCP